MPDSDSTPVPILVIHTHDPLEKIVMAGGTGNWKLNALRAANCAFVALTRKGGAKRGAAWLLGRIQGIVDSPEPGRKLIRCSDFVEVDLPNVWRSDLQNPVLYTDSSVLGKSREGLEALAWEPRDAFLRRLDLTTCTADPDVEKAVAHVVDIRTAKAILAQHFKTRPDLITITV
ncbi:hypothetical protein [Cupriavidus necator]